MTVRVRVLLPTGEDKTAKLVKTAPVKMLLAEIAQAADLLNPKALQLCLVISPDRTLAEANVHDGDTLLVYDSIKGRSLVEFEQ